MPNKIKQEIMKFIIENPLQEFSRTQCSVMKETDEYKIYPNSYYEFGREIKYYCIFLKNGYYFDTPKMETSLAYYLISPLPDIKKVDSSIYNIDDIVIQYNKLTREQKIYLLNWTATVLGCRWSGIIKNDRTLFNHLTNEYFKTDEEFYCYCIRKIKGYQSSHEYLAISEKDGIVSGNYEEVSQHLNLHSFIADLDKRQIKHLLDLKEIITAYLKKQEE